MRIHIDLETKSEADLPDVGAWIYAEHPTTEILCAGYMVEGSDDVRLWAPADPIPPEFSEADEFIARNAKFEYALIFNVGVPRYGFPDKMAEPWRWYDTQALCRLAGYPGSLGESAKALGLGNQKDPAGDELIKKLSIPTCGKNGIKWKTSTQADFEAMYDYCRQDVRTDAEAWEKLKKLPNFELERDTWLIDFIANIRGLYIDVPALDACLAAFNRLTEAAEAEAAAMGVNVRSTTAFPEWLRLHGVPVKTIRKGELAEVKSNKPQVRRALELREFLGLASVKKLQALKDTTSADGRCRYLLNYYGASTGRWSGMGVQVHNLTKAEWADDEAKKAVELIDKYIDDIKGGIFKFESFPKIIKRIIPGLIVPAPGKVFITGDFASIEARVIAWLSGCEKMQSAFRRNGDLYVDMAAALYRVTPESVTTKQRKVGKALILGCQYGLGYLKFIEFCRGMHILISHDEAGSAVSAYRRTYKEIPALWRTYEQSFELAWRKKKEVSAGRGVTMQGYKTYVKVTLPSGRSLYYHLPEYNADGQLSVMNYSRSCRVDIWGGVICENICQAVARDILADRVKCLMRHGVFVPFHVHDEIICEVPADEPQAEKINAILNTPPAWLPGFPLKTEIETNLTRYHK